MKKRIYFIPIYLILNIGISKGQYFFVRFPADTVFCSYITINVGLGNMALDEMKYIDNTGKKVRISGKRKLKNIISLYNGRLVEDAPAVYEKIPKKSNKPHGKQIMGLRLLDGLVDLLYFNNVRPTPGTGLSAGTVGKYAFYARYPDGTYHSLKTRKGIFNTIDYLKQCKNFKDKYDMNNFFGSKLSNIGAWKNMLTFYNNECK